MASVHAFFGAELRYWRQCRRLSQRELGLLINTSGDLIGKVEKALRWPSKGLANSCDSALATGGILARLWPLVAREHRIATVFAEQLARPPITWDVPICRPQDVLLNDMLTGKI